MVSNNNSIVFSNSGLTLLRPSVRVQWNLSLLHAAAVVGYLSVKWFLLKRWLYLVGEVSYLGNGALIGEIRWLQPIIIAS